jgi:hypothetical protein
MAGYLIFKKKAIFTFRTAFSPSFAMKFQRRHWLKDFAWRVERVTKKFRLSSVSFLSVYLSSVPTLTPHSSNDKDSQMLLGNIRESKKQHEHYTIKYLTSRNDKYVSKIKR